MARVHMYVRRVYMGRRYTINTKDNSHLVPRVRINYEKNNKRIQKIRTSLRNRRFYQIFVYFMLILFPRDEYNFERPSVFRIHITRLLSSINRIVYI